MVKENPDTSLNYISTTLHPEAEIHEALRRTDDAVLRNIFTQETLKDANLLVEKARNKSHAYLIRAKTHYALGSWTEFVNDVNTLSQYVPIFLKAKAHGYLEQYLFLCFLTEQKKLSEKPSKKESHFKITQKAICLLNQALTYSTHPLNKEKYTIEKFILMCKYSRPINKLQLTDNSSLIISTAGVDYLTAQFIHINFPALSKEDLITMLEFITKYIPPYIAIRERIISKLNYLLSLSALDQYNKALKENTPKARLLLQLALEGFLAAKLFTGTADDIILLAELDCRIRLELINKDICDLVATLHSRNMIDHYKTQQFKELLQKLLQTASLKKLKKEDGSKMVETAIDLGVFHDITPTIAISISNRETLIKLKKYYQEKKPQDIELLLELDFNILAECESNSEDEQALFNEMINTYTNVDSFNINQMIKLFSLAKKYQPAYATKLMAKYSRYLKLQEQFELLTILEEKKKQSVEKDREEEIDKAVITCLELLIAAKPAKEKLIELLRKKYQHHLDKQQDSAATLTLKQLVSTVIECHSEEQLLLLLNESHKNEMHIHSDSIAIAYIKEKESPKETRKEEGQKPLTVDQTILILNTNIEEDAKKYWLKKLIQTLKNEPSSEKSLHQYVELYKKQGSIRINDKNPITEIKNEFSLKFIAIIEEPTSPFTKVVEKLKNYLPTFPEKKDDIKKILITAIKNSAQVDIRDLISIIHFYPDEEIFKKKLFNLLVDNALEDQKLTFLTKALIKEIRQFLTKQSFLKLSTKRLNLNYPTLSNLQDLQKLLHEISILLDLLQRLNLIGDANVEEALTCHAQDMFNKAKGTLEKNKQSLNIPLSFWYDKFPQEKYFFTSIYFISADKDNEKFELLLLLLEFESMQIENLKTLSVLYKNFAEARILSTSEINKILVIANKKTELKLSLELLLTHASKPINPKDIIEILQFLQMMALNHESLELYNKVRSVYSVKLCYHIIEKLSELSPEQGEKKLKAIKNILASDLISNEEAKFLTRKCEEFAISFRKSLIRSSLNEENDLNKKLGLHLDLISLLRNTESIEEFISFYEKEIQSIRPLLEEEILNIKEILARTGSTKLILKFLTFIVKCVQAKSLDLPSQYLIFQLMDALKELNVDYSQRENKIELMHALLSLSARKNAKKHVTLEPRQEMISALPIINIILLNGYYAAIYGGHLLDALTDCKNQSRDIDIKTNMPLEEIRKIYPTGILRETSSGEKTFQVFLPCVEVTGKNNIKIDISPIYTSTSYQSQEETENLDSMADEICTDTESTIDSYDSSVTSSIETEIDNIPTELQEILSEKFSEKRLLNTLCSVGLLNKNFYTGKYELVIINPPEKGLAINFTSVTPNKDFNPNDISRMVFRGIRNSTRYPDYFPLHNDFTSYISQHSEQIVKALKSYEIPLEFKNMFFSEYAFANLTRMHQLGLLQHFSQDLHHLLESQRPRYLNFLKFNLPKVNNPFEAKALLMALCRDLKLQSKPYEQISNEAISFPVLSEKENLEKLEKCIQLYTAEFHKQYGKEALKERRTEALKVGLAQPAFFPSYHKATKNKPIPSTTRKKSTEFNQ